MTMILATILVLAAVGLLVGLLLVSAGNALRWKRTPRPSP